MSVATLPARVTVTKHAVEEAIKDFRVPHKTADEWIRSNLKKAKFIADIVSDDGKDCKLYGFQRIAFVLSPENDTVITVYPRHSSVTPLKVKVEKIVYRELMRLEKKQRVMERKNRIRKAELAVEKAQCALRVEKTTSPKVAGLMKSRIAEIDAEMQVMDEVLFELKKEKSAIAKSVVAYI